MADEANSDELATFVSSTLRAIAAGLESMQGTQITSAHGTGKFGFKAPEEVEFDIAVSAKRTGAAGTGLKVAVFGIGANAGGELASEDLTVSRIKFSVRTEFKDNEPEPTPISRYDELD